MPGRPLELGLAGGETGAGGLLAGLPAGAALGVLGGRDAAGHTQRQGVAAGRLLAELLDTAPAVTRRRPAAETSDHGSAAPPATPTGREGPASPSPPPAPPPAVPAPAAPPLSAGSGIAQQVTHTAVGPPPKCADQA